MANNCTKTRISIFFSCCLFCFNATFPPSLIVLIYQSSRVVNTRICSTLCYISFAMESFFYIARTWKVRGSNIDNPSILRSRNFGSPTLTGRLMFLVLFLRVLSFKNLVFISLKCPVSVFRTVRLERSNGKRYRPCVFEYCIF